METCKSGKGENIRSHCHHNVQHNRNVDVFCRQQVGHLLQSDAKRAFPEVYTQRCLVLVISVHQSRRGIINDYHVVNCMTDEDFSGDKQCVRS